VVSDPLPDPPTVAGSGAAAGVVSTVAVVLDSPLCPLTVAELRVADFDATSFRAACFRATTFRAGRLVRVVAFSGFAF